MHITFESFHLFANYPLYGKGFYTDWNRTSFRNYRFVFTANLVPTPLVNNVNKSQSVQKLDNAWTLVLQCLTAKDVLKKTMVSQMHNEDFKIQIH